jgi:DHA1 family tetracycline resistance protein-like MFS transporter
MSVAADPAADPAPARKRAMLIVFLVVAIDLLGFGIVLPLVPRYGDDLLKGYDPTTTGVVIGLMYSLFSLMQFVFSPVWGRVSDRIGRRPVLLVSLAGSVVFYGLFAFASTIRDNPMLAVALLLASRVGAGIAGASVSTAAAVIADCTPPERRAKGMALIGAAFGVGFTFGPLIAWGGDELLGTEAGPGLAAAGISAVALLMAAVLLPETLPPGDKPPREFFSVGRSLQVLRDPAVGPLVLIYFLAIFAFANFEGTLSLFTDKAFGLGRRDNYLVFAGIGLVLVVAQGLYRKLVGKRDEWYLLTLGAGLMLIGLGALALTAYGSFALRESPGMARGLLRFFLLAVAVSVVGFAFVNSSTAALVSRRADSSRQGEVLGVNQSFAALGRILGPFLGVVLFEQSESRVLPYAQAAVLMILVVALLPNAKTGRFTAEGAEGAERKPGERV